MSSTVKISTATKYFDAKPANKIRFVFYPNCNVNTAKARVELHKSGKIDPIPNNQIVTTDGAEKRAWWYADSGNYHVQLHVYNNIMSNGKKAALTVANPWFENYNASSPWI